MKTKIKVTMIGGKNVGKTCFLHGLYYVMRRGVNNFFLHTNDRDADNRLMRGWAMLNKQGEERRWPVPTSDDIARYNFSFKLGMNRTLMDFEWIDYRGGALLEETSSSQALVDQLNQSDCLLFCLDGSELQTPVGPRIFEVDAKMCISRAKVLLDRLSRRVPIAVLITKHDLCRHRLKHELMADIKLLFDAWLVEGEGWDVLICPVTLGRELADDLQGGRVSPKNLHIPLIYSIFSIMVDGLVEREGKAASYSQFRQESEASLQNLSKGFLSSLLKRKNLEATQREVEHYQRLLATEERAIERLKKDVSLLGKELTNAVMYCDGRRVGIRSASAESAATEKS